MAASVTGARRTRVGRYRHELIIDTAMQQTMCIAHGDVKLQLAVPNALCRYRAETFSSKEPETLEWIDALPSGSVLWDVGANVGLYALYAAAKRCCRVFAFEPSVFNLELLARNVHLNGLCDRVCLVPLALSDVLGPNQMRMTSTQWGGALSVFGHQYGWDGRSIESVFDFQILGLNMEHAVERLGLPQPDYIKIDVDGIEHVILRAAGSVLHQVKGVLIEINDDFTEQAEQAVRLLQAAGLQLIAKRHSQIMEQSTAGFQNTYNQIWSR